MPFRLPPPIATRRAARHVALGIAAVAVVQMLGGSAIAQEIAAPIAPSPLPSGLNPDEMLKPGGLTPTLKLLGLLTLVSLAPSILMMTTCFVRFVIVLGLLRQAFGTQQLPPNQVLVALSLFLTVAVMGPVWSEAYGEGIEPYTSGVYVDEATQQAALKEAGVRTVAPLRRFMAAQIEATGNESAIDLFLEHRGVDPADAPAYYEDVPLGVLLPAYLLSELKTAFTIGFQLYLPFVVLDMVVASVLIAMGMMMLPPPLISLPFKLLLFVLMDGWTLTVSLLLESVAVA